MELEPWHRGLRLRVAEDGYVIVSRRGIFGPKRESGDFLMPKSGRFRDVSGIRADLYRTIAADDLSRESIVALADRYGAIGRPVPTLPPRGGGETISADPVQGWLELWKLKLAVRLFDLIQQGDRMALESVIHVNAASRVANLWIRREKDKMHL